MITSFHFTFLHTACCTQHKPTNSHSCCLTQIFIKNIFEFGCFHPIVCIYNLLECAVYTQQTVISCQLLVVLDGACLTGYKLEFGCFHPVVCIYNLLECAVYTQQTVISCQLLVAVDGACLTGYKLEFGCFHPIVFIYNLLECAFYAQQTVISN